MMRCFETDMYMGEDEHSRAMLVCIPAASKWRHACRLSLTSFPVNIIPVHQRYNAITCGPISDVLLFAQRETSIACSPVRQPNLRTCDRRPEMASHCPSTMMPLSIRPTPPLPNITGSHTVYQSAFIGCATLRKTRRLHACRNHCHRTITGWVLRPESLEL
jgi:hypothetical protein